MSKVRIDSQEIHVWLACADGWHRHLGFKATIAGLNCSVCLLLNSLTEAIVSGLESGVELGYISISDSEILKNVTKEEVLDLMTLKLEEFVSLVECFGIDTIEETANQRLKVTEALFGERPKTEIAKCLISIKLENDQGGEKKMTYDCRFCQHGEPINDTAVPESGGELMVDQLLENEMLLPSFLRMFMDSEEEIAETERAIELEMMVKLGRKFARLFRQGQLKDGMILTLKARDMPYIVAGKVFVASDSAEIERFEVYIKSQSKESEI
ncbi:hypothetical protein CIC46_10240 [Listeria monocytogenes]|nr:hypothetical protein [Listeria monocytogenes]